MNDAPLFWEAWQPRLGQRVRVRLSGECNRDWTVGAVSNSEQRGHPLELDGLTGIVVERPSYVAFFADHPYYVEFDEPLWNLRGSRRNPVVGSVFAAIELEAISPTRVAGAERT